MYILQLSINQTEEKERGRARAKAKKRTFTPKTWHTFNFLSLANYETCTLFGKLISWALDNALFLRAVQRPFAYMNFFFTRTSFAKRVIITEAYVGLMKMKMIKKNSEEIYRRKRTIHWKSWEQPKNTGHDELFAIPCIHYTSWVWRMFKAEKKTIEKKWNFCEEAFRLIYFVKLQFVQKKNSFVF